MNSRELYIVEKFKEIHIELTEQQIGQFIAYYELLDEWNKVMNLTAITEFEEVVEKHFVDSLSLVYIEDGNKFSSFIDVGTGAGFPGIPIKIVFPHLNVVLLDSLKKRINFLEVVCDKLRLKDISAVHGRAEDFARKAEYRDSFDLCVSRAVANLTVLTEYCLPFVKKGGAFISYKSAKAEAEIADGKNAVFLLGGKLEKKESFNLPGTDISRTLLLIRKVKSTPKKYPRKPNVIKKELL